MAVTGITPATSIPQTRAKAREETRAEARSLGFSARHVILDLSREAMLHLGQEPLDSARPPLPLLFVYTDAGGFAYDNAARYQEDAQREAAQRLELERQRAAEAARAASPSPAIIERSVPSVITFDGRLGA